MRAHLWRSWEKTAKIVGKRFFLLNCGVLSRFIAHSSISELETKDNVARRQCRAVSQVAVDTEEWHADQWFSLGSVPIAPRSTCPFVVRHLGLGGGSCSAQIPVLPTQRPCRRFFLHTGQGFFFGGMCHQLGDRRSFGTDCRTRISFVTPIRPCRGIFPNSAG